MNKRARSRAGKVRRHAENILKVYARAGRTVRKAGREWYQIEHEAAADFGERRGLTVYHVAGALAAISPGLQWESAYAYLEALIEDPDARIPTYSRLFVDRAVEILRGPGTPIAPLQVLSGDKTTAFYRLIAANRPTRRAMAHTVVIDGHAWNICTGRRITFRARPEYRPPQKARIWPQRYALAADAYCRAAQIAGLLPHELQAITWLQWREEGAQ